MAAQNNSFFVFHRIGHRRSRNKLHAHWQDKRSRRVRWQLRIRWANARILHSLSLTRLQFKTSVDEKNLRRCYEHQFDLLTSTTTIY